MLSSMGIKKALIAQSLSFLAPCRTRTYDPLINRWQFLHVIVDKVHKGQGTKEGIEGVRKWCDEG